MATTPNGKMVPFVKCAYKDCNDTSLRRARGYCRKHFVLVIIDPYNRQERELLSALDILQTNKKRAMAELSELEMEHSEQRLLCHKCGGFTVKGWMALEQHQLYCTGKKKKGPGKPRSPKGPVADGGDDEEMTDEE